MSKAIDKEYLLSSLKNFHEKVLNKLYAKIPKNQSVLDKIDESGGSLTFNGDRVGLKGDPGENGANGRSAYEIAVERGYTGTETDWLQSLHGAKGDKGDTGEKGDTGAKGDKGDPGAKGEKGDPGEKGDTGAKGEKGDPGAKGDKGDKGDPGPAGINATTTAVATASANGLMGKDMVAKLNGIADGAEVNVQADWNVTDTGSDAYLKNKPTIPTVGNGTVTIKQGGTQKGTFTMNQSGNTTIELTDNNTTYSTATTSANGLMSSADKTKLNGIATGANNYSLPAASSSTRGGVKTGYTANGKNYPVQLSNEQMYVNVPWTDTNTVYTHPSTAGNKHIPSGGYSGQILRWTSNGTAKWDSITGEDCHVPQDCFQAEKYIYSYVNEDGQSPSWIYGDGDLTAYCQSGIFVGMEVFGDPFDIILSDNANSYIQSNPSYYSFSPACFYPSGYRYQKGGECYTPDLGTSDHHWNILYADSGTIQTSDRNEKKDISSLSEEQTKDFIMGLNPVRYKFKSGTSGRTHYGMISQDVEELMGTLGMSPLDFAGFCKDQKTETVTNERGKHEQKPVFDDGNPVYTYSIRYDEFIAPLIKMVQIQQTEMEDLKSRLAILEEKLLSGSQTA